VARAAPDGYTISIGQWGSHVTNGAIYALPYDLLNDFAPLAWIATGTPLIVSRNTLPAKNLRELVAWLKANPDKASQGTAGAGSPQHIAGIYFQKETATRFQFVPYRGVAPAMQDLVAGQLDFMIDQATNSLPQVSANKIRAYAVTGKTRLAAAPDIPTVDGGRTPGILRFDLAGVLGPQTNAAGNRHQTQCRRGCCVGQSERSTAVCRNRPGDFRRARNRRRRHSARCRRPRLRNGGLSSRPRASNRNERSAVPQRIFHKSRSANPPVRPEPITGANEPFRQCVN